VEAAAAHSGLLAVVHGAVGRCGRTQTVSLHAADSLDQLDAAEKFHTAGGPAWMRCSSETLLAGPVFTRFLRIMMRADGLWIAADGRGLLALPLDGTRYRPPARQIVTGGICVDFLDMNGHIVALNTNGLAGIDTGTGSVLSTLPLEYSQQALW
jgi:hypothetical protein